MADFKASPRVDPQAVTRSEAVVRFDKQVRRSLGIGDPWSAKEVAEGLLRRYPDEEVLIELEGLGGGRRPASAIREGGVTPAALDRATVERVVREVVLQKLGESARPGVPKLVVHASARHMHVSREDLDQLFGPGYELTVDRPLYQEGNFAAKEMVTLIGPRSRLISNLRILGPLRSRTQVELAFTDAVSLGLEVPIRLSGDLDGTPGAVLMGPRGIVEMKDGVIRAAMHVHMGPSDAAHYGVQHGDEMKLRVGGEAGLTFNRVRVRVGKDFRLDVHMDTDEANACGLHLTKDIELFK